MTCDELELLLPEGAAAPQVQQHLAGCERCQQTVAVLGAVAQPPASAAEKARLAGLTASVQSQWVQGQRRRTSTQTFAGLAIAASLGAVIASGVMWRVNGAAPAIEVRNEPAVLVLMEDDASPVSPDDESSFEVSWPSLNEEGDVL